MGRRFVIGSALGLVVLIGLGSWLVVVERNRTADARAEADQARAEAAAARAEAAAARAEAAVAQADNDSLLDRLAELRTTVKDQRSVMEELSADVERDRRRLKSLRRQLRAAQRELSLALHPAPVPMTARGPIGSHTRRLAPSDAIIDHLEVVPQMGTQAAQIVVRWRRGGDSSIPNESGILVWTADEPIDPLGPPIEADVKWRVGFEIYLPALRSGLQRVGPPGAQQRRKPVAATLGFNLGDVTRDGRSDILTIEDTHGSGGCAIYRVLTAVNDTITQIFKRFNCEGPIEIVRGMLRIDTAIYPKGCESAHGCGSKRTFLRWNGHTWDRVSSRITARD